MWCVCVYVYVTIRLHAIAFLFWCVYLLVSWIAAVGRLCFVHLHLCRRWRVNAYSCIFSFLLSAGRLLLTVTGWATCYSTVDCHRHHNCVLLSPRIYSFVLIFLLVWLSVSRITLTQRKVFKLLLVFVECMRAPCGFAMDRMDECNNK